MHAFDRALFRRGLVAIGVLLVLAVGVVAMTDEATSTAPMRVARLSALSPVISAVALLGIGRHARARGELAALAALGAPPWRALRGAEWAGFVLAGAAVVALSTPWSDAASLLPSVHPGLDFELGARGARVASAGLFIDPDGAIHLGSAGVVTTELSPSHWAVVPCLAPVALLVPAWSVTPMPLARRAVSAGVTGVLVVASLHFIAAGRLLPVLASAACAPLLIALRARAST
jgi:hypothetical protein